MSTARLGECKVKMAGSTRGREGSAKRGGNTTTSMRDKRTRGRCNKRTTSHDVAISWHDEMTKGWCDEMTRGRAPRGDATTSRHEKEDESAAQQEDTERHCNNKLVQREDKRVAQ